LKTRYINSLFDLIVIIALRGTVFELFDVESYHDLEIWVTGHSRLFILVRYHSIAWMGFPIRLPQ